MVWVFSLLGTHVLKGLVWDPGTKGGVGILEDGAEREDMLLKGNADLLKGNADYRPSTSQPFHRRHG